MSDVISRSWFVVYNNPEKHGHIGSPAEIVEQLKDEWIKNNNCRKGYWAYCISKQGTPHIHMILEGSGSMRFSAVKKAYPQAHLEPTKGSKKQILAYIKKEPPFDEKGEVVICFTSYGNIEGNKRYTLSNLNDTMQVIEQLIEEGKTPAEIMAEDIKLRREENLIRKAYFAKRYKETSPLRDLKVYWHLGESGSGKSYSYIQLCEKYGDENIYFFSDYANKGIGGFDGYAGEPILFMYELKKGALPYELLLTIMQGYRTQIHCRYSNCYALWNEMHITSVYSPEDIYEAMIFGDMQIKDPIQQLLRRIHIFIYHYFDGKQYKTLEISGKDYTGYNDLKQLAHSVNGFVPVSNEEKIF